MTSLALALLSLSLGAGPGARGSPLERALAEAAASAADGAAPRVELVRFVPPRDCAGDLATAAFDVSPFDASGRVPVRVRGSRCSGWAFATVRVFVRTAVLRRPVATGAPLAGAYGFEELERRGGARGVGDVPEGATATRSLRAGARLTPEALRVGPPLGTALPVRITVGALSVDAPGHVVACPGAGVCAQLANGRRVRGEVIDGVLASDGARADSAVAQAGRAP